MTSQPSKHATRISSLDGLRALSIGLVLYGHVWNTPWIHTGEFVSLRWGREFSALGVMVFFVISGFLITTLLLGEWDKSGTIHLAKFYFRRTLRIFPAFYFFLGCALILKFLGELPFSWSDFALAATYLMDFKQDGFWQISHTWSLATEEQFYLVWPFILKALGPKRSMRVAGGIVLLSPILRVAISRWLPEFRGLINYSFITQADSLAIGCLLAGLRYENKGGALEARSALMRAYVALRDSPWVFLLIPLAFACAVQQPRINLYWGVCETVMIASITVIIDRVTRETQGAAGRLLNWGPLVYLGQLSYSLYLWQQLFLTPKRTDWLTGHFPLNLVMAFALGLFSYYAVEKPMLALRERLEPRWFPRRRVSADGPSAVAGAPPSD